MSYIKQVIAFSKKVCFKEFFVICMIISSFICLRSFVREKNRKPESGSASSSAHDLLSGERTQKSGKWSSLFTCSWSFVWGKYSKTGKWNSFFICSRSFIRRKNSKTGKWSSFFICSRSFFPGKELEKIGNRLKNTPKVSSCGFTAKQQEKTNIFWYIVS